MTTIELSNSGLQILIFLLLSRQTSFLVFFSLNPQRKKKNQNNPNKWPTQAMFLPQYKIPNFCMIWLINSNSHILGCSKGRLMAHRWTLLANKGAQLHLRALITGVPLHQTMRIVVGIFFFFSLAKWRSYNRNKIKGERAYTVLFSWTRIHFPLTMRHRPKNKNKTTFIQYRQVN